MSVQTLAERLGHRPDDRLLIITSENLGCAHATNAGVFDALRAGLGSSASLMVPCPWARDAAAQYRGDDVGVHLTLNAPYDRYRWGAHHPGAVAARRRRRLPPHRRRPVGSRRRRGGPAECRAQIEAGHPLGGRTSTTSAPTSTRLLARRSFFDVYLEMAVEFALPARLAHAESEAAFGFPFRQLAADEGVLGPDRVIRLRPRASRASFEQAPFRSRAGGHRDHRQSGGRDARAEGHRRGVVVPGRGARGAHVGQLGRRPPRTDRRDRGRLRPPPPGQAAG